MTINDKSIDGVLRTQIRGGSADESTELWRPPPKFFIVVPIPISFVSPKHVRVELWLREKIENKKIANVHSLLPNLMVRL